MADKAQKIDHLLDLAEADWRELPEVADEFDDWDYASRMSYIVEWDLVENRLRTLERLSEGGQMAPEQLARFSRLKVLVAEARPILEGLRMGTPPPME